jgi:hypothetical protein
MKIHLINKRKLDSNIHYIGLNRIFSSHSSDDVQYSSEAWALSEDHAGLLKGGMIYLHTVQAEPAFFGGRITEIELIESSDNEDGSRRYRINFSPDRAAKGAIWPTGHRGPNRWTSFPIPLDPVTAA